MGREGIERMWDGRGVGGLVGSEGSGREGMG